MKLELRLNRGREVAGRHLGEAETLLGLVCHQGCLEDSTEIRLWNHDEPDSNLRRKHWCQINGQWRAFIEAAKDCSSAEKIQRGRITLAELTRESRRGITSLKGWRSPELPQCQSTGAVKEEQALNEHHCMGCSNYRWRTELKNYCQDAAGGGKQWISLSSRRLDLDADADIVGLLMCLFSNWVACPPRGLEGTGLNSLLLRGRKQVWSKSLAPLPSVLLLGSTRLALPGRQDPQATSDVHVEPPPPHRLSSCSHHGLGTGLATFLTLHQTIPSDSSCSPKLGYFPWGVLSEHQFFQAEAMPAFHFLFFPHTLTRALSVGSFV